MNDKIADLKEDLSELEGFLAQAKRQKVKDCLSLDIRKLSTELTKLQEASKVTSPVEQTPIKVLSDAPKCYQVKLNNYAWDQTSQFVKFYVTLSKVQTLPPENISCTFTSKSLEMQVRGLENKDYLLNINKLLHEINPAKSSWKVKSDMVIISAAKCDQSQWECVTEVEKRAKDAKKMLPDKMDKSTDPSESLMSMMKNMYDQGDDDMKRTIAKAWTESQGKRNEPSF